MVLMQPSHCDSTSVHSISRDNNNNVVFCLSQSGVSDIAQLNGQNVNGWLILFVSLLLPALMPE